jgi:hypothetical protein
MPRGIPSRARPSVWSSSIYFHRQRFGIKNLTTHKTPSGNGNVHTAVSAGVGHGDRVLGRHAAAPTSVQVSASSGGPNPRSLFDLSLGGILQDQIRDSRGVEAQGKHRHSSGGHRIHPAAHHARAYERDAERHLRRLLSPSSGPGQLIWVHAEIVGQAKRLGLRHRSWDAQGFFYIAGQLREPVLPRPPPAPYLTTYFRSPAARTIITNDPTYGPGSASSARSRPTGPRWCSAVTWGARDNRIIQGSRAGLGRATSLPCLHPRMASRKPFLPRGIHQMCTQPIPPGGCRWPAGQ